MYNWGNAKYKKAKKAESFNAYKLKQKSIFSQKRFYRIEEAYKATCFAESESEAS